jgi:putative transposase
MPREKRGELPEGFTFFVSVKVNRGFNELQEPRAKKLFEKKAEQAKKKYPCEIYNFVVMDNHVHIMIRPLKGTCLSKLMQWLLSNFTKAWNRMNGLKTGRLWGERFHCRIIESPEAFERAFKYTSDNPVKAGMVEKAEDWGYSGPGHYISGRTGLLDLPDFVLALYRRCHPLPETPITAP